MPISPEFAASNRAQTERLKSLASKLDDATLRQKLSNDWTVGGILTHIAVWDRQRLCLMRRWAAGDLCFGGYHGELFNDAMKPILELIPGDKALAAAIQTAEEVDAFLLEVSDEVVAMALARPDAPNLNRGLHREGHLDQIEELLRRRSPEPGANTAPV